MEDFCPFAIWRGPIPNRTVNGRVGVKIMGAIEHVQVGSEMGTDSWFHNPSAQASADFGIGYDGTAHQWVTMSDKSWAESRYNPMWRSFEFEGYPNEPLTDAQLATGARLFLWCSDNDGFALQLSDDPNTEGFGTHGMLGQAGGGHLECPGEIRAAQRPRMLELAQITAGINAGLAPSQQEEHMQPPQLIRLGIPTGGTQADGTVIVLPGDGAKPWAVKNPQVLGALQFAQVLPPTPDEEHSQHDPAVIAAWHAQVG